MFYLTLVTGGMLRGPAVTCNKANFEKFSKKIYRQALDDRRQQPHIEQIFHLPPLHIIIIVIIIIIITMTFPLVDVCSSEFAWGKRMGIVHF